jgi:DNA polymerase-3 subunit beta
MKCSTHPKELQELVSLLSKIPLKHPSFAFLDKILLLAESGTLTLRVSNLSLSSELSTFATVEQEGKVLVDPFALLAVIQNIPDNANSVELALVENELLISSVGVDVQLPTFSTEDVPYIPIVEDGVKVSVNGSDLTTALRSVSFSASNTDIKPELASVFVQFRNSECVTVATDGYRLAEYTVATSGITQDLSFMIPAKLVSDLIRLLDRKELTLQNKDDLLAFTFEGGLVVVRTISGNYPDYRQIIPQEFTTEATLLKEDIMRASKLLTSFTDQFTKIDVSCDKEQGTISFSSPRSGKGAGIVSISAQVSGEDVTVRMSAKNILDALNVISDQSVIMRFNGAQRPITCRGFHDTHCLTLMMPMSR